MTARWFTPLGLHMLSADLPVEGRLPGFDGATGWLNSPPRAPEELRGKVVLVDFWTYTCVNWLRQLPYVRAWAEKYRDDGLIVVGAHTPYRFTAWDVNAVMGPAVAGGSVRYRVSLDGRPPGDAHGGDVDARGDGAVVEQGLSQLVRQPRRVEERTVRITFLDPGVEVYSFTFG